MVVVEFLIIFDEVGPAIVFGIVAHIVDVAADDAIGLGNLVSAGIGGGRVINEFVFVDGAVATVVELVVEEDRAEAGHLEDGSAGVNGVRGDDVGKVIELGRDAAGGGGHEVEEDFALSHDLSLGAVDGYGAVNIAEELIGGESDIEANATVLSAGALRAFDADSGVVVGRSFIIDDGAG